MSECKRKSLKFSKPRFAFKDRYICSFTLLLLHIIIKYYYNNYNEMYNYNTNFRISY